MLKNTEQIVEKLFNSGLLSNVAIRVGVGDKVLGEVYRSNDSEITENTLFDMASVTKILSVTAVSLIALDSGKIGLHDKVSRYFPVFHKCRHFLFQPSCRLRKDFLLVVARDNKI